MTLVAWNCNMAFRKKLEPVLAFSPDVAVISECEEPSRWLSHVGLKDRHAIWIGDNRHKGLAVVALNPDVSLRPVPRRDDLPIRFALPVRIEGALEFNLLALWAMDDKLNRKRRYIGQVWEAINAYEELLREPSIVAGDFNGNVIWDTKDEKRPSMSMVIRFLEERGMKSLYHASSGCPFGQETDPTWCLYRSPARPFHLDYIFASEGLCDGCRLSVGTPENWLTMSDHMPLFATFASR
jgi:endonuclease/exonuclease/phosphatase family metal-dependent hydrolase